MLTAEYMLPLPFLIFFVFWAITSPLSPSLNAGKVGGIELSGINCTTLSLCRNGNPSARMAIDMISTCRPQLCVPPILFLIAALLVGMSERTFRRGTYQYISTVVMCDASDITGHD